MHADCIFALLAEWDLMLVLYLYAVVLWTACTVMNPDACTLSPGGKIVVIKCIESIMCTIFIISAEKECYYGSRSLLQINLGLGHFTICPETIVAPSDNLWIFYIRHPSFPITQTCSGKVSYHHRL